MIDTFSILLSHALLFVACWRLLSRADLDDERQDPVPQTAKTESDSHA